MDNIKTPWDYPTLFAGKYVKKRRKSTADCSSKNELQDLYDKEMSLNIMPVPLQPWGWD